MKQVSIIVPVYNTEKYLEDCIESVLNQSYQNIELILVDDGSTDGSGILIDEYARKYLNIKAAHQENRKLGAARNRGIEIATGDYLLFLDSDDWIEKQTIETLVKIADDYQLDMVLFDGINQNEIDGYLVDNDAYDRTNLNIKSSEVYSGRGLCELTGKLGAGIVSCCMVLFSTRFIRANGLTFVENVFYEDNDFSLRSYYLAKRIKYVPQAFYNRRVRIDSITTSEMDCVHIYSMLIVSIHMLTWMERNANLIKDVFWEFTFYMIFYNKRFDIVTWIKQSNEIKIAFTELLRNLCEKFEGIKNIFGWRDIVCICEYLHIAEQSDIELGTSLRDIRGKLRDCVVNGIEENKTIVVYGAGKNGKRIAESLNFMGISSEVIFAETNSNVTDIYGFKLINLVSLSDYSIERIIISSPIYADDIKIAIRNVFGNIYDEIIEVF